MVLQAATRRGVSARSMQCGRWTVGVQVDVATSPSVALLDSAARRVDGEWALDPERNSGTLSDRQNESRCKNYFWRMDGGRVTVPAAGGVFSDVGRLLIICR